MKKGIIYIFLSLCMIFFIGCNDTSLPSDNEPSESQTDYEYSVSLEPMTEAAIPEEAPVYTASFVGAGDNIVYYGNVRDAKSLAVAGGREYNFRPTYSDVESFISSADIAFINQETLMCGEGYEFSYYPMFNGPQDLAYDLCDIGFDIINIANNHMLDKGGAGLAATIDFWKTMPVTLIGGYSTSEEFYNVPIVETNGIKIAYISYVYSDSDSDSDSDSKKINGITMNSAYDIHIPFLDENDIKTQCESVKDKCDLIIASVHWGKEGSFTPNDTQRKWAKVFADNGVDVIIGHHPHVIQPIEWIESSSGNKTLCVYSLGDFMAEQDRDYNMLGGFITFDITKTGDSHAVVDNVVFEPTVFYFPSNFYNNHIYFFKDFTEELAASHGVNTYYKNTLTVDGLKSYLTNTISEEFLPDYITAEN